MVVFSQENWCGVIPASSFTRALSMVWAAHARVILACALTAERPGTRAWQCRQAVWCHPSSGDSAFATCKLGQHTHPAGLHYHALGCSTHSVTHQCKFPKPHQSHQTHNFVFCVCACDMLSFQRTFERETSVAGRLATHTGTRSDLLSCYEAQTHQNHTANRTHQHHTTHSPTAPCECA